MEYKGVFFNISDFKIQSKEPLIGPNSIVYVVEKINKNEKYIAKIINIRDIFEGNEQMIFLQESEMICKLDHPLIIKIDGINFMSLVNPKLFNPTIITDYFPNGTLKDKFNNYYQDQNWTATKKYINLLGICDAFRYLHEQSIFHIHLKPENILLDSKNYPHISDYYYSKCFPNLLKNSIQTANINTMIYLAPEILQNEDIYNESHDIYSFAMIAYQILTNTTPFLDQNLFNDQQQLRNKIISGYRPSFPEFITQKMQNLLSKCWNKIPEVRPSFADIFEILSNDTSYSSEPIDEFEIKNYLSMIEESKQSQKISSNDTNLNQQIRDLKAVIMTCFADNFANAYHPNNSMADIYYEKAAELDNDDALNLLGDSHFKKRNYIDARQFYEKAAKKGNAYSLKMLGDIYMDGKGVEKNYIEARKYYEESARKGCLQAMKCLGDIYFYGRGVEKNFSRAVIYYQRAGDDDSIYDFGNMYFNGQGVEKDPNQAKEYFQESAKLGNAKALVKLNCHYCDYNYCKYFKSFFALLFVWLLFMFAIIYFYYQSFKHYQKAKHNQ